eukprot:gnl/TRDRNA2_/TRDRNA2_167345_c0_seq1.p1 gnl/TRDRNA2_/TRDRNA2_167345_c0~~gnl/TRDRNA2_/TRDRNA2_167345_c0_seq1.p1  ORF type:complete len:447 (+),score=51.91 gnl/TRDRNA2_/TRDRNA2_167345_c0_seq1:197-1342(+)
MALLAEDFWGMGTGPQWVLSLTCICSPLRGTSLVYAAALEEPKAEESIADEDVKLRRWSFAHWLAMVLGIFNRAQWHFPWLKGIYHLHSEIWGAMPLNWDRLVEAQHPYWTTGDNLAVMAMPSHCRRMLRYRLPHLGRTRLVAVMADGVGPMSPSVAARSAAPFGVIACAVAIACRRRWHTTWPRWHGKISAVRYVILALLAVVAVPLAHRNRRWGADTFLEPLLPKVHGIVFRPLLRLVSYFIHKTESASSLDFIDFLGSKATPAHPNNDGCIDIAAQCPPEVPVTFTASHRGESQNSLPRASSAGQGLHDVYSRERSMSKSLSHMNVPEAPGAERQLAIGKWRVIRVPGADHALGTSLSPYSIDMYSCLFELLETVSRR